MATDTVTCLVIDRTWVDSTKPSTSRAGSAKKQLQIKSASMYPLFNFGLPRDYRSRTCTLAVLEVALLSVPSSAPVAQRIAQPNGKSLGNVTWNNKPGTFAGSAAVAGTLKAGTTSTYQFVVTAEMQAVCNGDEFWGFQVTTSDTTLRYVKGEQAQVGFPSLTMTLTDATPAPAQVGPAGVVSIAKPTFVWASPNDVDQIRLQVDAIGGAFTSPVADTGVLAAVLGATAQQINTATTSWASTAWAGLSSGAAGVDVRVWQKGPLGGAWSAPVTVSRVNLPALTITNPANGSVTNDPTPQDQWTFANQTQFWVTHTDAAGKTWFDTQWRPGADQSFTPVLSASQSVPDLLGMTVRVRAKDNVVGRVVSPGDPGYAEATSTYTVAPDAATTGPTAVTAAQVTLTPAIALGWTRASGAPDEWLLIRDGVILARFAGTDSQVTSTTWSYVDWTAAPNVPHVYSVAAVVSGKASTRVAASSVTAFAGGLWVYDPSTGAYFSLAGENAADGLAYAGSSAVYKGQFSSTPIKKSFSLRGLEGQVSGQIDTWDGRSIAAQTADAMKIRANPSGLMRVAFGDHNFPALITDMSPVTDSDAMFTRLTKRVSFTVDQVGELPATMPTSAL